MRDNVINLQAVLPNGDIVSLVLSDVLLVQSARSEKVGNYFHHGYIVWWSYHWVWSSELLVYHCANEWRGNI